MDFDQSVAFVRKYAVPGELLSLRQAPSTSYKYNKATIHLTYYSMPDWLAVISAARWPKATGSGEEPIQDVLWAMAIESNTSAVMDFVRLLEGKQVESRQLFRQLVLAYRTAVNEHQRSVAECLKGFTKQGSGKALLAELGRTGRSITVVPHWHHFIALPGEGFHNASQRGIQAGQSLSHIIEGIHANDTDGYAKGALIENMFGGNGTGTGRGANSIVYYSAGTFGPPRCVDPTIDPTAGAAGFQPDVVLYHELAHATRTLSGKETHVPVEGPPNFGNIEEYFATVLANIYLSETRPDDPLRGVYAIPTQPTEGWAEMKNPDGFYDNADNKLSISPRELMDTFLATQGDFYGALAALPTPPKFNPPREHFQRAQKMRALSNQKIDI
jgi:hypothetical protein